MVDMQFLGETAIAVAILAAIALIGSHWSTIAAVISGEWHESLARARAQKAARELRYGYVNNYGDEGAYDMSSDEDDVPVSSAPVSVSGIGIQRDTGINLSNLTEDQIVEALARRKDARGKYAYSGKKIYALVGGNYNEFVANVRRIRGDEADLQPEAPAHVTPIVGRRTNAQFETDPEFPYVAPSH